MHNPHDVSLIWLGVMGLVSIGWVGWLTHRNGRMEVTLRDWQRIQREGLGELSGWDLDHQREEKK